MNWFNGSHWIAMLFYCSLTFFIFPKIAVSISKENNADMMGMLLGFVISISFTISTAILIDALIVLLPERVCSNHNLFFSTVNPMSCKSI